MKNEKTKQNKCGIAVNNQACNGINKTYKFQEVYPLSLTSTTNLHFYLFIIFLSKFS